MRFCLKPARSSQDTPSHLSALSSSSLKASPLLRLFPGSSPDWNTREVPALPDGTAAPDGAAGKVQPGFPGSAAACETPGTKASGIPELPVPATCPMLQAQSGFAGLPSPAARLWVQQPIWGDSTREERASSQKILAASTMLFLPLMLHTLSFAARLPQLRKLRTRQVPAAQTPCGFMTES